MRIKFLKDHLGHTVNTEEEVGNELANYLIRCSVAEEVKEDFKLSDALKNELAEKEEIDPKKEKKETTGLPTAKRKKK